MFSGGLYAHVRHPRYTGMFCAVAGAALLAGTPPLWIVLAVWWLFALLVIRLEEKELAARFGAAYMAYRNASLHSCHFDRARQEKVAFAARSTREPAN